MGHLRRVFYVSRADASVDSFTMNDIVLRAQRSNRRMDVTGVLAYSGKHFAQVLEGSDEELAALTTKISRDKRHSDVVVLFDEPISKRDYGEWSMGFLYDASLGDEIEQALTEATPQAPARDGTLARKIFLHVSDLARP
ncbi:MAG: hypothetical protein C0487_09385 [Leptothrix sp. (in: Bacteria)]|nr:hypothetical protein [Leptothrix sp. (in: b-proteobacteria)]